MDSRTQESQRGRNDLSWFGLLVPYVQQLMILILKSTQNLGVTTECKRERERFGRGSLGALYQSAVRSGLGFYQLGA